MPNDDRKQVPLRLSKAMWEEINAWAQDEFRSVNGQIEYILQQEINKRKKSKKTKSRQNPES